MKQKLTCLDGLRGWAALVVFIHHFLLGFCPQWDGLISGSIPGKNLKETPLFFLANGTAAVTIFFVLSGFVLSLRLWNNSDKILTSALKRWPRLIILPLISVVLVYFISTAGLFYFKQASQITHSVWMDTFGFSSNNGNITERFIDTFLQGYLFTFFRGDQSLNSSLWTMNIEFIGSCLVFAFVSICNKHKTKYTLILALLISMILFFKNSYYYVSFLAGAILSKCYIDGFIDRLQNNYRLKILTILSIIFLGYVEPGTGFYNFMTSYNNEYIRIYLHTLSAVIIICFCLKSETAHHYLSNVVSSFLGKTSFALYVIHVPIFFSLSSRLFVELVEYNYKLSLVIVFSFSLLISLVTAYGLSIIDEKWCRLINKKSVAFDNLTKT